MNDTAKSKASRAADERFRGRAGLRNGLGYDKMPPLKNAVRRRLRADERKFRERKRIAFGGTMIAACAAFAANVTDVDDTSWWSLSDGVLTLDNDLTVDFAGRPDLNLWAGEPVAFVSGTATLSGPVRTANAGDVKAVTFARDGNMIYAIAASGGMVLLFK